MTDVAGPGSVPAWVESPFQLLGALEAHSAGLLGRRLDVLPRKGVEPLATTIAEVTRLGLPAGVSIRPPSRAPLRGRGRGQDTLAVGDAFSGAVHRLLVQSPPQHLVLLDDGRSTRRVMDALLEPDVPLVRPHIRPSPHRALLARLAQARLRRMIRRRRLVVITALDLPERVLHLAAAAGIPIEHNDFAWLRGLPPVPDDVPAGDGATIVLGTSMVANRLIRAEPYLNWIRTLAAEGPLTYRAHRREDASTLAPLAASPGVTVIEGRVPVEVSLRGLTEHSRLLTLPTTAVSSLRLIAPQARIQEFAVPRDWWCDGVPQVAREHLVPDGVPEILQNSRHSTP